MSNFSYRKDSASQYHLNIIGALLTICADNDIKFSRCEVCGCPEQYLVGYGMPIMDCCRKCYPSGFDSDNYQVMYYEELYTDKYKYLGQYSTIEEARQVSLPNTGYRCIFKHRKKIEQSAE